MRGRRTIFVIGATVIVICTAVYFLFARAIAPGCDQTVDRSALSPDGRWVAASTGKACPVGFLSVTDYSVSVTLGPQPAPPGTKPTVIFELTDAGQSPTLTWVNPHELIVRLNDPGEVQISKHELAGVKISYVVPNWMWANTGTIEADRARTEGQAQALYKEGKLDKKDLRAATEISNAAAKARSGFRQWIIDNASIDSAPSGR